MMEPPVKLRLRVLLVWKLALGVQYVSIRYTERLAEAGIEPSVGSRGDSYDNALAESIIGLYKTEVSSSLTGAGLLFFF